MGGRSCRHPFRPVEQAAVGMIAGFGVDSYVLALEAMVARLRQQEKKP